MNTFQALVELQERDKELKNIKESRNQLWNEMGEKAKQINDLRDKCKAAERVHTAAEINLRRLELERASENQNLSATRDQLFDGTGAPTWRDEQRLQEREQELINRVAMINERITPVKEEADDARAKLQDLQAKLDAEKSEWEDMKDPCTRELSRLWDEFQSKKQERDEAAAEIPADQLFDYNRLWDANKGRAVATVEREVCNGCSERLSSGELNELKLATEPRLCHCGKFLITLDSR